MAVSLAKGEKVNLSKMVEKLANVTVGLGWDMASHGSNIDCDSSVFVLRENKKSITKKVGGFLGLFAREEHEEVIESGLLSDSDIVYYNNLHHRSGCVNHRGDNLVGGHGKRNDDEQIAIDLKNMPEDVKRLAVAINIYACRSREQHFGMIKNCYARIVDDATKEEICRYNLSNDYNGYTALIVAEFYRENGEWHFEAVGKGTKDENISSLARRYK